MGCGFVMLLFALSAAVCCSRVACFLVVFFLPIPFFSSTRAALSLCTRVHFSLPHCVWIFPPISPLPLFPSAFLFNYCSALLWSESGVRPTTLKTQQRERERRKAVGA